MPHFAFVRCRRIPNIQALRRAAEHGARRDISSEEHYRPGASLKRRALGWSLAAVAAAREAAKEGGRLQNPGWGWIGAPHLVKPEKGKKKVSPDSGLPVPAAVDYVTSFKARKKAAAARERKGSAVALHLLIGVSPEWICEAGGLHDVKNERLTALLREARRWAEDAFGEGSVIGLRLDVDETGGAVIDAIVVPVHDLKLGRAKEARPTVSVAAGLRALAARHGLSGRDEFAAVQSDWTAWAQKHLDPALVRGKERTGRKHIVPDEYRRKMEKLEAKRAALEAERDDLTAALPQLRADCAEALQEKEAAEAAAAEAREDKAVAERAAAEANAETARLFAMVDDLKDWVERVKRWPLWRQLVAEVGMPPDRPASGETPSGPS